MKQTLLQKLEELHTQAPDIPPLVTLSEFFEGNKDEESIAANQLDYGRPPIADMYKLLKEIEQKSNVQAVFVGMHFDWAEALKRPKSWPEAENVHIYTSAEVEEVMRWVENLEPSYLMEGWPYGEHPAAPEPKEGFKVLSLCWD